MAAHEEKFWWFQGASVVELADRLVGADPATARLEVRIGPADKMTFRVVPASAVAGAAPVKPDINESFLCPPICP